MVPSGLLRNNRIESDRWIACLELLSEVEESAMRRCSSGVCGAYLAFGRCLHYYYDVVDRRVGRVDDFPWIEVRPGGRSLICEGRALGGPAVSSVH